MTTAGGTAMIDLLESIRSKNAGPFTVCVDLFFKDRAAYDHAVDSGAINPEAVGALYRVDPAAVRVVEFVPALAVKVSMPRLVPGGAPGDRDVAGGQQFVPLLELTI